MTSARVERTLPLSPLVLLAACGGGGTEPLPAPPTQAPPVTGQSDSVAVAPAALTVGGNVLANDSTATGAAAAVTAIAVQGGASGTVGQPLRGAIGQLTLQAGGTYSYAVDADSPTFMALAEGQAGTDVFLYTPSVNGVAGTPQALTITVTGRNDAPIAANDDGGTAAAGAAMTGSVLANDRDPDAGASLQVTAVRAGSGQAAQSVQSAASTPAGLAPVVGTYGTLTMNADGSYSYMADATAAKALKAGQTATETFTYTVTDGKLSTSATLNFTVTGVNDAPTTATDTGSVTEDLVGGGGAFGNVLSNDGDADGGSLVVTAADGQLLMLDPDPFGGASVFYRGKFIFLTGKYGQLYLEDNGKFIYSLNNNDPDTNALATGQTVVDEFVYTVADGQGGTSTGTIRIAVNGADEPPPFGATPGSDAEVNGTAGDDVINALGGDDVIHGMAGADTIDGGAGNDTASYERSFGRVRVSLSDSSLNAFGDAAGDVLTNVENLRGSTHSDTLIGDAGANRLDGGDGEDVLVGLGGADHLDGGAGHADTVDYSASNAGVTVDFAAGTASGGHAEGDRLFNIDVIIGSTFADTLRGNVIGNRFDGGDGDDIIEGREGNDELRGGNGADHLDGGADTDLVDYSLSSAGVEINLVTGIGRFGEAEGDILIGIESITGSAFDDIFIADSSVGNRFTGLEGRDVISYAAATAGVIVTLRFGSGHLGDAAGDVYVGIEDAVGSAFDDVLVGDAGTNDLRGGLGNDTLDGGSGGDRLDGGGGIDFASYSTALGRIEVDLSAGTGTAGEAAGDVLISIEALEGSSFNDLLIGDDGDNAIYGDNGIDELRGGNGDDLLEGNSGVDTLVGGAGADIFSFVLLTDGGDIIRDFSRAEGDKLGFDAARFPADFEFVSGLDPQQPVTTKATFLYDEDAGTLKFDVDGSGGSGPWLIATFENPPMLTASDIVII